jgi:hypothetical protein
MGRKRGLFGSSGGFNASMPQDMAMPETAQMGGGGFVPEERPGLGTRLLGKGWEEKAIALGGALMGNQWAIPQYLQQQGAMQRQAEQQAAAMRAQAQRLAAAQRMGISADQAVLLGDNIGSVVAGQMKPAEGPKLGSFEWWNSPTTTPEQKAAYSQYMDVTNPVMATTWQGPTVIPRRPPVGAKVSLADLGPEPQAAPQAPRVQTAAPIRGAETINQREYQEMLTRRFGGNQRAMNAYMAQNNIIAGN